MLSNNLFRAISLDCARATLKSNLIMDEILKTAFLGNDSDLEEEGDMNNKDDESGK